MREAFFGFYRVNNALDDVPCTNSLFPIRIHPFHMSELALFAIVLCNTSIYVLVKRMPFCLATSNRGIIETRVLSERVVETSCGIDNIDKRWFILLGSPCLPGLQSSVN